VDQWKDFVGGPIWWRNKSKMADGRHLGFRFWARDFVFCLLDLLLEIVYSRWWMTPKGGVAKVTWPTFEAMGQIPAFHRTYFLSFIIIELWPKNEISVMAAVICILLNFLKGNWQNQASFCFYQKNTRIFISLQMSLDYITKSKVNQYADSRSSLLLKSVSAQRHN